MLKRLFYASAAVLMLAIAWHVLASDASGQTEHPAIVGMSAVMDDTGHGRIYTIAADGNVYVRNLWNVGNFTPPPFGGPDPTPVAQLVGNFWGPAH